MIQTEGNHSKMELEFATLEAKQTDLVSDEFFFWLELKRPPTIGELRHLHRLVASIPDDLFFYANVDSRIPTNMEFARRFGFRQVGSNGHIAIMVLEKPNGSVRRSR